MEIKIYLSLLSIATIFLSALGFYILTMKIKKQINYAFVCLIISMVICNVGYIIAILYESYFGYNSILLSYMPFLGEFFLPVMFLLVGLIFAKSKVKIDYKLLLLLLIPILSNILLWTNDYHGLLFKGYRAFANIDYGNYFYYVHLPFNYGCIILALYYFIRFSIKNAGFFSRQAKLIVLASLIPFLANISWVIGNSLNIDMLKFYSRYDVMPIGFTVTIICFVLAIFKFDFLNVVPIALQKIVDLISDSYIVINENGEIIDYNQTLINTFSGVLKIKRKEKLRELISSSGIQMDIRKMDESTSLAEAQKASIAYEEQLISNNFDKFFDIEITPIFTGNNFIGSIILFKDITEHKKNIEIIKRNQEVLLEQERMASLGQMIGSIAHNLKTPIMSIAGGIEALKDLTKEYIESVEDENVTPEDHYEIAKEMQEWLEKMKPYCSYMTDIISAVKGQAVQMNYSGSEKFTLQELVKRVDVLMRLELKKYHCTLDTKFDIDLTTEIKGEINSLIQIIDNLIINAIQSYEGDNGNIGFIISKDKNNVEIIISDHGKGIPEEVQKRLFKEMFTTKGKNGTGLGLYMSYSTIKGRFSGNMRFESIEGSGTTFYITIPYINAQTQEADYETVV